MRLFRTMIVTGSAALAAGALTMTVATTATTAAGGRSAHTAAYHAPSVHFLAAARLALVRYLKHHRPVLIAVPHSHVRTDVKGAKQVASLNWSGYEKIGKKNAFTSVSAKWTQETVTCSAEDQMSATWVGLDGFGSSDPTVEQDGTTGWCYEGKPTYFTWYEMFPKNTVEVGTSLRPGDKISASVSRSGSLYTLKVTDATHASSSFTASKKKCTSCKNESIEWVQERPLFADTGIIPLAHYGSWKATAVTGKGKGTTDAITMIDSTEQYILSSVGSLSGGSFTTKFHDSY